MLSNSWQIGVSTNTIEFPSSNAAMKEGKVGDRKRERRGAENPFFCSSSGFVPPHSPAIRDICLVLSTHFCLNTFLANCPEFRKSSYSSAVLYTSSKSCRHHLDCWSANVGDHVCFGDPHAHWANQEIHLMGEP